MSAVAKSQNPTGDLDKSQISFFILYIYYKNNILDLIIDIW